MSHGGRIDEQIAEPYRSRSVALPADTEPLGAPPRDLPRRLRLALMFDGRYWYAATTTLPIGAVALVSPAMPMRGLALVALSVLTIGSLAFLFAQRRRLVRLLERGIVAPARRIDRVASSHRHLEQTRMRVLPGWRREIETHDGPMVRTTLRVGGDEGPTRETVRTGGEWDDDLCLFDPRRPERHVFLEDLPPFAGVRAGGGWAFVDGEQWPHGSRFDIASGVVAIAYSVTLAIAGVGFAVWTHGR